MSFVLSPLLDSIPDLHRTLPRNQHLEQKIAELNFVHLKIHDLFYRVMQDISHRRLELADLQKKLDLCNSVFNDIIACMQACNFPERHLFDELQLDYQNPYLQENKVSEVISGLDLEPPLIPDYSRPINPDQTAHKTFFRPTSSLALRTQTVAASLFLLKFQKALPIYTQCLESLALVCQANRIPANTTHAYIPRKTKSFILKDTISNLKLTRGVFLDQGAYGNVFSVEIESTPYVLKQFKRQNLSPGVNPGYFCFMESGLHQCIPPRDTIISFEAIAYGGLILEYADNKSLYENLHPNTLSYQDVVTYFSCIADALEHIHSRGFNYKDLKPDNVLLFSNPPRAKLCDFGEIRPSATDNHIGVPMHYAAPEIASRHRRGPVTAKADCWSFGVVLFEVLTDGLLPFLDEHHEKPDYMQIVSQRFFNKSCTKGSIFGLLPRNTKNFLKTIDPEGLLSAIAVDCLHGNPIERLSMTEIKARLNAIPRP